MLLFWAAVVDNVVADSVPLTVALLANVTALSWPIVTAVP